MRQTYIELENSNIIPQDRETTQNHKQNNQRFEEYNSSSGTKSKHRVESIGSLKTGNNGKINAVSLRNHSQWKESLYWVSHMLMLWVPANLTLRLKGGRTIVIGLLKGCLIMSRPNLFSLLPDLSVMVSPYVTVPIFCKFLLGRSAIKIVLLPISSKF